jgi:hypothetical protein
MECYLIGIGHQGQDVVRVELCTYVQNLNEHEKDTGTAIAPEDSR